MDVCYQLPMKSMHGYQLGHRGKVDLIRNGVDGVMVGGGSVYTKYQTSRDYGDVAPTAILQAAMNTMLTQPTRAETYRSERMPDWAQAPLPQDTAAPEITPTVDVEQKQAEAETKKEEEAKVMTEEQKEEQAGKGKVKPVRPKKGKRIPKRKPDPPLPITIKPLNDDGFIKRKQETKGKRKQDPAARLRKMLSKKKIND